MSTIEIYARRMRFRRTQWRWRFVASNGEILAISSEGYNNKADMENAIQTLKVEFPHAAVEEWVE